MRTLFCLAILMLLSAQSSAETYSWIDENGTHNYSDDYNSVPKQYRKSVGRRGDLIDPDRPQNVVTTEKISGEKKTEQPVVSDAGEKQLYGGKTHEAWRKEFDIQEAELMRLELRLGQLRASLKNPVNSTRGSFSAFLSEYDALRAEYKEKYKIYSDLIESARKAGLTVEMKK